MMNSRKSNVGWKDVTHFFLFVGPMIRLYLGNRARVIVNQKVHDEIKFVVGEDLFKRMKKTGAVRKLQGRYIH